MTTESSSGDVALRHVLIRTQKTITSNLADEETITHVYLSVLLLLVYRTPHQLAAHVFIFYFSTFTR